MHAGVVSAALEDDKIIVVGDVDSVTLTMVLRKKMGYVDLLSVAEEKKEEKKDEKKGDDKGQPAWPIHGSYMLPYVVMPEDPYRGPGCIIW